MKKHLNTLYITSDDAYIHKDHETFIVEIDNKKVFQAPVHSIENIVCFGYKIISPSLMAYCAENNIGICYLSPNGKFLAKVYGAQKGNVLIRKQQYLISDDEFLSMEIARPIIAAKVSNYRYILQRHQRNHSDICPETVIKAIAAMGKRLSNIEKSNSLNELRGYEGESAQIYFSVLSELIVAQKSDFVFANRSKRPPLDAANSLLSFIYAILVNDVRSALETTGLDPQVGFLHQLRAGRPSLALDVMEEFRAYMGDRIMLNLINLKQVNIKDFEKRESGEIRMSDKARKAVLAAYQKRKQETITHPFLQEKMTIGLLPHIQAKLLARYIRGDIEKYTPFYLR
ncbi:MAG: type I-C CRISPR-associated endonuclease Cas1 [Ignavibacteriae bacterium]|nr:type I-C CRISPR-associated endonuclease Cas1 [Ignavibacteriota bacterium]NOG98569.1 type I-C CRISPR-associated endonuclease Cas1 [Ignavibacteriota bacterium]